MSGTRSKHSHQVRELLLRPYWSLWYTMPEMSGLLTQLQAINSGCQSVMDTRWMAKGFIIYGTARNGSFVWISVLLVPSVVCQWHSVAQVNTTREAGLAEAENPCISQHVTLLSKTGVRGYWEAQTAYFSWVLDPLFPFGQSGISWAW